MKQFSILYYNEKENRTATLDTDRIEQVKTTVFLNTVNSKAETMVFTNPGAKLIYYRPAKGKATIDTYRLSRY